MILPWQRGRGHTDPTWTATLGDRWASVYRLHDQGHDGEWLCRAGWVVTGVGSYVIVEGYFDTADQAMRAADAAIEADARDQLTRGLERRHRE